MLRKHATCSSCDVRLVIVLRTRYARVKPSPARATAKSPAVTSISVPPGRARSSAVIAGEISIPCTRGPRRLSGIAMRPVPAPSSRTGPGPANAARKSTTGSMAAAVNSSGHLASYVAAIGSSKLFSGMRPLWSRFAGFRQPLMARRHLILGIFRRRAPR